MSKIWNWSSFTKFALSARSTHSLIAQSLRASDQNSSVLGLYLGQSFYSYFYGSVTDDNLMCHLIQLHSWGYLLFKTSIKIKVTTGKGSSWNEIWTLSKRWNWSSCTKLAVSVSWTHGLIGQLVRAPKQNLFSEGLNPTQANFIQLLMRIRYWWIPYYQVITLH